MTRLRIGHIIGKHPTGLSEHCQVPETVDHVLVNCRKYTSERKDMMEGMRRSGLTGVGLKGILEFGESGQGRKCLVTCLKRTGLIGKI